MQQAPLISGNDFCAALLYSNKVPHERQIIADTREKIQKDPTLSRKIHLICTDNPSCQSHMRYNQAGIQVPKTAVFLIKPIKAGATTQIIPIALRDHVFDQFKGSSDELVPEPAAIEPILGKRIPWMPNKFPADGSGRTMTVKAGDQLNFVSNDGMIHDVTEANAKWEPLQRFIPRQPNLNKMLEVTQNFKPTTHLICSVGDNHEVMRLKLVRNDPQSDLLPASRRNPTEEILEGILKYNSSKGDQSDKDVKEPQYHLKKVTIKTKPQIVEMKDGTRVRIVSKPKVIIPDDM